MTPTVETIKFVCSLEVKVVLETQNMCIEFGLSKKCMGIQRSDDMLINKHKKKMPMQLNLELH